MIVMRRDDLAEILDGPSSRGIEYYWVPLDVWAGDTIRRFDTETVETAANMWCPDRLES